MMNPYRKINLWVKTELYEVKAYKKAILSLGNYTKEKDKLANKLSTYQTTLAKLQSGKSTLKTMFSNKKKETEMNNLVNSIPIVNILFIYYTRLNKKSKI